MSPHPPGPHVDSDQAARQLLQEAGVRPTAQRVGLARLLFGGGHRHVVATELHLEAAGSGLSVSVATVYNTLGHFVGAGLLREVTVDGERTWYDTNVGPHGHLLDERSGELTDVPLPEVPLPEGVDPERLLGVEVLFRVG